MDVLSSRILPRTSDLDRSRRFYRDLLGLVRDPPQRAGQRFRLLGIHDGPAVVQLPRVPQGGRGPQQSQPPGSNPGRQVPTRDLSDQLTVSHYPIIPSPLAQAIRPQAISEPGSASYPDATCPHQVHIGDDGKFSFRATTTTT